MADAALKIVQALGAVSAGSGTGSAVDLGERREAAFVELRVTANAGTLAVTLQTSPDGSTGWRTARAFGGTTETTSVRRMAIDQLDRYARVTWTASVSATFGVEAEAFQLYADRFDLDSKLPRAVIERADEEHDDIIPRALIMASADVETALGPQYGMPATTVPMVTRSRAAALAAKAIVDRVGFVGGGVDEAVALDFEAAAAWLDAVRRRSGPMPHGAAPAASVAARVTTTTARVCSARRSFWSRDEDC